MPKVVVYEESARERLCALNKGRSDWTYTVSVHPKINNIWVIDDGSGVTIPKDICVELTEPFVNRETPPNGYNPLDKEEKKWEQKVIDDLSKNILISEDIKRRKEGLPSRFNGILDLIEEKKVPTLEEVTGKKPIYSSNEGYPTEQEVKEWLKQHEEEFGFDHNSKLLVWAFYYWTKSPKQ